MPLECTRGAQFGNRYNKCLVIIYFMLLVIRILYNFKKVKSNQPYYLIPKGIP